MAALRTTPPSDWVDLLESAWAQACPEVRHIEVALSGGLDSVCLLRLLVALGQRLGLSITAVHVNHQISPHAEDWQEFCQWLCVELNVPLRVARVSVARQGGESLEAEARRVRYAVFADSTTPVLALAHHADDQAETVMLQLLRGAGARGLAAMPVMRALTETTQLWRPLLHINRQDLTALAEAHDWLWVEDESNLSPQFRRNFIRQTLFPVLAEVYTEYRAQLARVALRAADAAELLDELARSDLEALVGADGSLDLEPFAGYSAARMRNALMAWVENRGGSLTPDALDVTLNQLLTAAADSAPTLQSGAWCISRYRSRAYLFRPFTPPTHTIEITFEPPQPIDLPDWGGRLRFNAVKGSGIAPHFLGVGLTVRPRTGGEVLPQFRIGSKPLKTLLQEAAIPPFRRERLPLLYLGETLLAAPGVGINSECLVEKEETGYVPIWVPFDGL